MKKRIQNYLTDVSMISKVVNKSDCLVIDEVTGDPISKDAVIENFAIIYDTKPFLYKGSDDEPKKKRRGRPSKNETSDEDIEKSLFENEINTADDESPEEDNGEEGIRLSREEMMNLIAKELKINVASYTVLANQGWYMCPIMKDMTEMRPVEVETIKNGYRLVLKKDPLFTFEECPFDDIANWKYNAAPSINAALGNEGAGLRFQAMGTFRHNKDRNGSNELKVVVHSVENAQKTRIKVGNNLISSLYNSKGNIGFNELKEKDAKEKGKDIKDVKVIELIEEEYLRLNAAIEADTSAGAASIKALLKKLSKDEFADAQSELQEFILKKSKRRYSSRIKSEEEFENVKIKYDLKYITSYCVYNQIREYLNYKRIEEEAMNYMKEVVHRQLLWQRYLIGIKGLAETTAAYIMANFNIYSAEHPSGFLRYVGLDQIAVTPNEEEVLANKDENYARAISLLRLDIIRIEERSKSYGETINEDNFDKYATDTIKTFKDYKIIYEMCNKFNLIDASVIGKSDSIIQKNLSKILSDLKVASIVARICKYYEIYDFDTENGYIPLIRKRARSKRDKEVTTYLNKDGHIKTKQYLGYNAALKGKLLGVLFTCFMRAKGDSGYERMYRNFYEQIDNRVDIMARKAAGLETHVHRMAARKTMQEFVKDLWINWRKLEGLPLNGGTYEEAKLGHTHHQGDHPTILDKSYIKKSDIKKVW